MECAVQVQCKSAQVVVVVEQAQKVIVGD